MDRPLKPENGARRRQQRLDELTKANQALTQEVAVHRARAEAALSEREAELERAHAHLTEAQRLGKAGSFTWNIRSGEDIWSEEIYRIFDIDPSTEVTWSLIRQFIHPDDLPAVEAANEGKIPDEHDYLTRIVTPHGVVKYVRTVAHRSKSSRHIFFGTIQDVTETVLREQELTQARAELARMARVTALSALTATIAHEVSQPLTGIVTNAGTCLRVLDDATPNLEAVRAASRRILRDASRASEVIQRLRSMFARKPLTFALIDLNDTAREVLALSSGELQRRKVALRTDFAADLPMVRGDRVQLQQVILNLVLNAADSMSEVAERPRDLMVTSRRDVDNRVRLQIRDAGVGLDAQSIEKLFDPFFTTKPEGMGIGLSISRSIVEAHEGRLWAEQNGDGPGATFAFSIPCVDGSGAANRAVATSDG